MNVLWLSQKAITRVTYPRRVNTDITRQYNWWFTDLRNFVLKTRCDAAGDHTQGSQCGIAPHVQRGYIPN
jgi:hypothetical protein